MPRDLLTLSRVETYREIGIRSHGKGLFHKQPVMGHELGSKRVFWLESGDFVLNIVFAWEGAVGRVTDAERGMIGSHRFPTFRCDEARLDVNFLVTYFKTPAGIELLSRVSPGGAGRNRTLSRGSLLEQSIPLPPLPEQRRIVGEIEELAAQIREARSLRHQAAAKTDALVLSHISHLRLPRGTVEKPIIVCSSMGTGTTPPSYRSDYYGGAIQWYTPGDLAHQRQLGPSSRTLSALALA